MQLKQSDRPTRIQRGNRDGSRAQLSCRGARSWLQLLHVSASSSHCRTQISFSTTFLNNLFSLRHSGNVHTTKFSNNIISDCPLQNKRFRCPIKRMYSFSKVKLCISLKFYRQCLREGIDGHVWFRHFFHGQRSTRINIYHCCSVLYCWCLCPFCYFFLFLTSLL